MEMGDSMILAFRLSTSASGREQCDIARVFSRVQSLVSRAKSLVQHFRRARTSQFSDE